ncbi:MAG: glycerol-3-phosphate cytidylyltransferase [Sediminicola sp.]|jgi:glycerol-3-phosphate cytidylyltransferase|tara:strand:+ start:231 stop:776 length:546 start_codon:yes stop_codon:yes gene_type:complete
MFKNNMHKRLINVVISLEKFQAYCKQKKKNKTKNKGRIGLTCSTFDLFHAGHVKMLEDAKKQCDYLIVALQVDPTLDRPEKNKPVQNVVERYIQVSACVHVDEVVPYVSEQDLEDIFASFDLDVRIIGVEYANKPFTAKKMCEVRNIDIYYNKRDHRFSSSGLRQHTYNVEKLKNNEDIFH